MFNFLLEGEAAPSGGFNWLSIAMIGLVIVVFYFLLIRPEKKRERAAQEMRSALQVGDEVTTIGGIIGKVVSIKEETFVLETTRDRTRIRFLVTAIRSVDVKAEEAGGARARATGKVEEPVEEAVTEAPAVEEAVVTEEPVVEETVTAEDTDKQE